MATALAYPDTEKGGRGKKSFLKKEFTDASAGHVSKARFVLRNCRDKALEVLRNSKYPLTVAYEEAQIPATDQQRPQPRNQRRAFCEVHRRRRSLEVDPVPGIAGNVYVITTLASIATS